MDWPVWITFTLIPKFLLAGFVYAIARHHFDSKE